MRILNETILNIEKNESNEKNQSIFSFKNLGYFKCLSLRGRRFPLNAWFATLNVLSLSTLDALIAKYLGCRVSHIGIALPCSDQKVLKSYSSFGVETSFASSCQIVVAALRVPALERFFRLRLA